MLSLALLLHVGSAGAEPFSSIEDPTCLERTGFGDLLNAIRAELVLLELDVDVVADDGSTQIELRVDSSSASAVAAQRLPVRVRIERQCGAAALNLTLSGTDRSVLRVIELNDVPPEARDRTVAVALVELVRTTLNALEAETQQTAHPQTPSAQPAPPPKPSFPRPSAEPQHEAEPSARMFAPGDWMVSASVLLALAFSAPGQMLGGEIAANIRQRRGWRWAIEVSHGRASQDTDFGTLRVKRWGLAAGGEWCFADAPGLAIGPRFELSALSAQGHSRLGVAEDEQLGIGIAVGPRVAFEVALSRHLLLRSSLDAKVALRSVTFTAGGRKAFSYEGLLAAWAFGPAWAF